MHVVSNQLAGRMALVAWAAAGTLTAGVMTASAANVVWDGGAAAGGTGNSWETPANWSPETNKPLPADTAEFGDTGIVANKTITLGGVNQTITGLTYNTALAFTI